MNDVKLGSVTIHEIERQKKFRKGLQVLETKTGSVVYCRNIFDRLFNEFLRFHEFQDNKTRGVVEAEKQIARRVIVNVEKRLFSRSQTSDFDKLWVKKQILRSKLENEFSLKNVSCWGGDPISKNEILLRLLAPFAVEIRDPKKLNAFIRSNRWRGEYSVYLTNSIFSLREEKEVIRYVAEAITKGIRIYDLLSRPQKIKFSTTERIEYQKNYQKVLGAFKKFKREFNFYSRIQKI